jgi:anaerobic magnesium-protoporphyrin IX monomethyl ester cyclase
MKILFVTAADSDKEFENPYTFTQPNLGLLTLMSALQAECVQNGISCDLEYLDGKQKGEDTVIDFITKNSDSIAIVCFSALTSNYASSVRIASHAKRINPGILTIFGNDHFSVLYERIMRRRPFIDYGFRGNDVVEGFVAFVMDILRGRELVEPSYAGLVYRDGDDTIACNPETPEEYARLPLIDYSLMDATLPHSEAYIQAQWRAFPGSMESGARLQGVDIARGCIKFAGRRLDGIPENACDFCGIAPGEKALLSVSADLAWARIKNVVDHGYNELFITADELPMTFWPLLRQMAESVPDWHKALMPEQRPKLICYARADFFESNPERLDILVDILGFREFFIGLDGFSDLSLQVMNKPRERTNVSGGGLLATNFSALRRVSGKGCKTTAGVVVTHLGITKEIMAENYSNIQILLNDNQIRNFSFFASPLFPLVGSHAFRYMMDPDYAKSRADRFGLRIDHNALVAKSEFYRSEDELSFGQMLEDFVEACCPDISMQDLNEYLESLNRMAADYEVMVEGNRERQICPAQESEHG